MGKGADDERNWSPPADRARRDCRGRPWAPALGDLHQRMSIPAPAASGEDAALTPPSTQPAEDLRWNPVRRTGKESLLRSHFDEDRLYAAP